MNSKQSADRFGPASIAMHWLMFILIVAVYATIELRGQFPRGSGARDAMKSWHFMLGLTVFALVWLRLLARLAGRIPLIVPAPSKWQLTVAHAVEYAIYAFMAAMPLLGWLILSAENKPIPFFGVTLPALIAENKPLAKQLEEVHETLGNVGYFLLGAHALAALMHHYIRRDNTLVRMLPGGLRRRSGAA